MFKGFSPSAIRLPNGILKSSNPNKIFLTKFILYFMLAITIILIVTQVILPALSPEYKQFIEDMTR